MDNIRQNYNFNMSVTPDQLADTPWFQFGQYSTYYCLLLETWKQEAVFFGLNDDGCLVAYVKQGFNFMDFYTFPVGLLYGHMIVRYQGTITPFFRKFLAGNRFVREECFNLMDNVEAMRAEYAINNLHWDKHVADYWKQFFDDWYASQTQPTYTPNNIINEEVIQ